MSGRFRPWAFLLPVIGFVGLAALLPAGLLFAQGLGALGGPGAIGPVLANPLNEAAIRNSLVQGGLSAAAAFLLGYPVGVFLGRVEWRGRPLAQGALMVPFLLPSLVVVLSVQDLFGPAGLVGAVLPAVQVLGAGLGGIVVVNVVFNLPLVALLTAAGAESSSGALEETVLTLGGSPARAYRDVWGVPSLVGAAAGALLTFLFSALAFAAPLLLCGARCYTLEVRVYSLAMVLLEPAAASVLALVMVAVLALPAAVYLFAVYRLRQRTGVPRRTSFSVRRPVDVGLAAITGLVLGGTALVLGAVVLRSLLPPMAGGAWGSSWNALFAARVSAATGVSAGGAVLNTILLASAAAILSILLGIVTGHAGQRRPRAAVGVQFVLFVPLLLSPVVLAFALAQSWRPLVGGEGGVWVLILISQATLALPLALQGLQAALGRLPPGPREAAELQGAGPFRAYLEADLPRVAPALLASALFAFAIGLGEFTATYFLATPAFTTLPVLLYDLESVRQIAAADAAAALLLLVSLVALIGLALGGRRVEL